MPGIPAPILIVEPDKLQRDLIVMALRRRDVDVLICNHVADLRRLLGESKPGLMLLDIHLPGVNGLDLLAALRSEGLLERTRVFVLSSMAFPEIVRRAIRLGANDFLVKPLDVDLLAKRIKNSGVEFN